MDSDNYNYDFDFDVLEKEIKEMIEHASVDDTELKICLDKPKLAKSFSLLFDKSAEEYIDKFVYTTKNSLIKGELTNEEYNNLKKTFKEVDLIGNLDDIITFTKNNLEFLQEKIVTISQMEDFSFTQEIGNKIMTLYEMLPQATFLIKGNEKSVSAPELKRTIDYINNIINIVDKNYLSPLEKIMVYYDIVRESIYKMESNGEDHTKSRDLTAVITGDNIVCSGYAHKLQALLDASNIRNHVTILIKGDKGHARNLVYVDDDKYNVHGLYFIDATFNRKKTIDDSNYRNRMSYFARSYNEIIQMESNTYEYEGYKLFGKKSLGDNSKEDITVGICNILSLLGSEANIFDIYNSSDEKISALIKRIYEYSHKPIPKQTFLQLMYNVRKFEYSLDKNFGRFTKKDIEETFENRYIEPIEITLLKKIFGELDKTDDNAEVFDSFFENIDFNRDYLKIQLAQLLNEVKNKKEQSNLKR